MIDEAARKMMDAWVIYHVGSGSIAKILLREPKPADVPSANSGQVVLKTQLSERAISKVHQLRVIRGRVVHAVSLGGI